MKRTLLFLYILSVMCTSTYAQTEIHNTMFMFNKLAYNPAYAGSREVTSISGYYRDQWSAIDGAPKTYGATFDAPLGNRSSSFRELAMGLVFSNEQIGVERKQNITGYYSFRFKLKNETIMALGLNAGVQLYSANYATLNPFHQNDPNLAKDVNSALLPNFGTGFFWYNDDFYLGGSIPNIIQNYYDKNEKYTNKYRARQVRGYYLNGGYVFHANESFDVLPQGMVRYTGDGTYQLPINCDINLSFIFVKRFLLGVTYRTDKSFEGIVQMQVTKNINLGYSYDYLLSGLSGYNNGAHEIVIGYDFNRHRDEYSPYEKPHFAKLF